MKKSSRDYRDFLEDIAQYAEKGRVIVADIDYDEFKSNEEKILTTIRVIEVIGESAKRILNSIRDRYPEVPWIGLARMRDKIIHVYFGVDTEVVWQTLQEDLPPLQESMKKIISDLDRKHYRDHCGMKPPTASILSAFSSC
jgi:uncharacterized protein with HEPN domain